ncbi:siderophore-iron reductase FhuF [Polycladospora coralii]|uniref:siderophore-iron reductase FhuF n=1 Tax=Polycladospora coralii TaxID=2771432 RepID=UPI00322028E0
MESERNFLEEHFNISFSHNREETIKIPTKHLLNESNLLAQFQRLSLYMNTNTKQVIASQFSKRYAYTIVSPVLFAMSILNKQLNTDLSSSTLGLSLDEEKWKTTIYLSDLEMHVNTNDREAFRSAVWQSLFRDHLTPIWHALATYCHVSPTLLWENTAAYIFWLYEQKISSMFELSPCVVEQAMDDFHFMMDHAAPSDFGVPSHPLKRFYTPKNWITSNQKQVRKRKTCCLYYATSDEGKMCGSCPKNRTLVKIDDASITASTAVHHALVQAK